MVVLLATRNASDHDLPGGIDPIEIDIDAMDARGHRPARWPHGGVYSGEGAPFKPGETFVYPLDLSQFFVSPLAPGTYVITVSSIGGVAHFPIRVVKP